MLAARRSPVLPYIAPRTACMRVPQVNAVAPASWPETSDRSAPTYELGDLLLFALKLAPVQPTELRAKRSQSHSVVVPEGSLALTAWLALARGGRSLRISYVVGGILLVSSAGICCLSVCHVLRSLSGAKHAGELLLDPQPESVHQLVCNYLLIPLVGASLILASELLLLCAPTRRAGINDAQKKWEDDVLRSLIEVTGTFAATTLFYRTTKNLLLSLQLGPCCGALFIFGSELLSSTITSHVVGLPTSQSAVEMPPNQWVKRIPVLVRILCFVTQVYAAIVRTANVPLSSLLLMLSFVAVAALTPTGLSLIGWKPSVLKVTRFERRLAARICLGLITLVALKVSLGLSGVVFSFGLSAFCIAFSRECWDEIELNDDILFEARSKIAPKPAKAVAPSAGTTYSRTDMMRLWSIYALSLVKTRCVYFYRRLKWTFMGILIASTLDICATVLSIIQQDKLSLTLSQYFAINVVVSASVGYLTSPAPYALHPVLLLYTGMEKIKLKWSLFPLDMFVEALVFVGVFVGTFAASCTCFSSFTLATLSGMVISVGGHWLFCSRLHLSVETHMRIQLTATCALFFCLLLITDASMVSLFSSYRDFDSTKTARCLASLAGIFCLAARELFLMWKPTREVGLLLQHRVTHASQNWRQEPLRSFLELFTWFAVICESFAMYDDLMLALQLGTLSGIAVTLLGDFFRKKRSKIIPWGNALLADHKKIAAPLFLVGRCVAEPDRAHPLPVMLLFAYIGSGTFHWIFEHMQSLEVTVLLATIAGIVFLCFADMLVLFKPTRWAGVILQDRFIDAKQNWREYPVRSFVELGCFMGVIYGSHAIYHDLVVAVQVGTLSGMLVTLGGEKLRNCARAMPLDGKSHYFLSSWMLSFFNGHMLILLFGLEIDSEVMMHKTQILPLPVMCLLGLVGAVAFNIIYTHLRSIEVAFVLATTSGIIFALVGDMFVIWKPTRKVGMILQERLLFLKMNFACHARRSWMEVASLCSGWYLSYDLLWPGDLLIAIQFGTTTGIVACICGELTMEYVAEAERRLKASISTRLAQNPQKGSLFISLPYEVQFEVAHLLTAEDLLVVRATCCKMNNMLKAESARFWLHASLRRTIRDHPERSRAYNISCRMGNRARSLVYEAITLVLPKIVGARDPAQVLTSCNEVNRAIKWVYLNADWIRKQNLPPLMDESDSALYVLTAGDVAFDVFRHMPDKSSLGIAITRNDDFAIEHVHVPKNIYNTIQQDPFSFVAAETLYTLEVISNWHLTVVAFATMTLIFIGQMSSDLLRAFILPASFTWWGVR